MTKKFRTLLVSLGVAVVMLFAFAGAAMAAGFGGGDAARLQEDCPYAEECINDCDPIQQRLGQSADRVPGEGGGQERARVQDCVIPVA